MRKKFLPFLIAILVTLLSFATFIRTTQKAQNITDMKELNTATSRIASQLSNAFAYADTLELLIQYKNTDFMEKDFLALSDIAKKQHTCIDSFQLAPDAVVTYINPLEGNEAAVGHDLLADEDRKGSVLEAIDSDDVVMQGPVESKQGKILIFGRKAIKIDDQFWGLSIISINFNDLLEDCGLSEDNLSFNFCINAYDSDNELIYTWGDEHITKTSPLYTDLQLAHARWRITIQHRITFIHLVKDYGIYLLISILVGFAAYIISNYYMSRIHSAKTDPLTETLIRSEFRKYVHNTLKHQKTCALLVLDMDHFKSINDTYGHLAGDEVLIHAALEMQRSIRHGDLVSRVGGDEYMILLHNIETEEQVLAAISRIRKAAEQEVIFGKNHIQPELSIGYALSPEEGDVFETLYQLADKRMYQDKLKRRTSK